MEEGGIDADSSEPTVVNVNLEPTNPTRQHIGSGKGVVNVGQDRIRTQLNNLIAKFVRKERLPAMKLGSLQQQQRADLVG